MDALKGFQVEKKGCNWVVRPPPDTPEDKKSELLLHLQGELKKSRIHSTTYWNNNDPRLVLWDQE